MTENKNSLKPRGFFADVNRKSFLIVNLILLAVNLAVFAVVSKHPERIAPADEYSTIAQGIAFSGKYIRFPVPFPEGEAYNTFGRWVAGSPEPDSVRMPGYPVFLAAFYKIFGYEKLLPVITQIFIRMATVNFILFMFASAFTPGMAIFFGIVNALDMSSLTHAFVLASEILFAFFLIASLLFYRKFYAAGNKGYLFVSFVLSGIAVLVRAVAVFSRLSYLRPQC